VSKYSFYAYKFNDNLKVDVRNLRVDGESHDERISNKSIDVGNINWKRIVFDVVIDIDFYEHLFSPKEANEIRVIAKLSCRKTYFRSCEMKQSKLGRREFKITMALDRKDVRGVVNLDVFVARGKKSRFQGKGFAEEIGQRIVVQGEEEFYWNIIVDEPESKGIDIEIRPISFKKDEELGLKEHKNLNYYLDLHNSNKPILYANKDWKKFMEIWDPMGPDHRNKRAEKLQDFIDRTVAHDVTVQIVVNTLREAYDSEWYTEDSAEGYKEGLIIEWMKKLDPEAESREEFIQGLQENHSMDLVAKVSVEAAKKTNKGKEIDSIITGLV
jgi:hypothetical protein